MEGSRLQLLLAIEKLKTAHLILSTVLYPPPMMPCKRVK